MSLNELDTLEPDGSPCGSPTVQLEVEGMKVTHSPRQVSVEFLEPGPHHHNGPTTRRKSSSAMPPVQLSATFLRANSHGSPPFSGRLSSAASLSSAGSSRRTSINCQPDPPAPQHPHPRDRTSLARMAALATKASDRLERLSAKYREVLEENARLRAASSEVAPLRDQLAAVLEQNESLLMANQFLQRSVGELIAESEDLKRDLAAATHECSVATSTLTAVRAQHDAEARAWEEEKQELRQRLEATSSSPRQGVFSSPRSPRRGESHMVLRRPGSARRLPATACNVERQRLVSQETLLRGLMEMDQLRAWRCLLQLHAAEHRHAQRRTVEAARVAEALQTTLPWASNLAPPAPLPTSGFLRPT